MGRVRYSMLKSLSYFTNSTNRYRYADQSLTRSSYGFLNLDYRKKHENYASPYAKFLGSNPSVVTQSTLLNLCIRGAVPFGSASYVLGRRSFSWSSSGGNVDKPGEVSASIEGNVGVGGGGGDAGIDWINKAKDALQSASEAVTTIGSKTKEVSDELIPYCQQLVDTYPVSFLVGCTIFSWVLMPGLLRIFHKYSMKTPAALLSLGPSVEPVPFEKSFWGALDFPVRFLVTVMVFLQIGQMVAPTTISPHYLAQGWRGAVVLSFIWFLYRWKTNLFSRALTARNLSLIDKEKVLTLDRVSSVGLFVIGLMALAEACGVAVQSILTVGGIGGVATAFAARDVLGNVLSGFSMQFSKPFSLGDTIKAGSIEGQVVEMGLTTTMLLNAEKFPVIVPNSLFSSQVIVNKSRAQWRAMITKIPVNIEDLDKIPQISIDIKSMLKSNPKVFLEKEAPFCFLSSIESYFAELTIGCNLRYMSKDELYSTEQDILLQSVRILKEHGATLGSTWQDKTTH